MSRSTGPPQNGSWVVHFLQSFVKISLSIWALFVVVIADWSSLKNESLETHLYFYLEINCVLIWFPRDHLYLEVAVNIGRQVLKKLTQNMKITPKFSVNSSLPTNLHYTFHM